MAGAWQAATTGVRSRREIVVVGAVGPGAACAAVSLALSVARSVAPGRALLARLELTPDERDELARLLGEDSLGALLRRWSDFVTQVERGYDDSIYEYTNDLSVRGRLDEVVAGAGPGLRAKLDGALAEDDRRFTAATEESARPLGRSRWSRRVPARRVGELADDLESLGYLS